MGPTHAFWVSRATPAPDDQPQSEQRCHAEIAHGRAIDHAAAARALGWVILALARRGLGRVIDRRTPGRSARRARLAAAEWRSADLADRARLFDRLRWRALRVVEASTGAWPTRAGLSIDQRARVAARLALARRLVGPGGGRLSRCVARSEHEREREQCEASDAGGGVGIDASHGHLDAHHDLISCHVLERTNPLRPRPSDRSRSPPFRNHLDQVASPPCRSSRPP